MNHIDIIMFKVLSITLIGLGSYILLKPIITGTKPESASVKTESDFRAVTSLTASEKFYLETRRSSKKKYYRKLFQFQEFSSFLICIKFHKN